MSDNEEIPTIASRIGKAERDCDGFLAVKMPERHLEACPKVKALQLQLTRQYGAALGARPDSDRMLDDFRIAERIANNARRTSPTYPGLTLRSA